MVVHAKLEIYIFLGDKQGMSSQSVGLGSKTFILNKLVISCFLSFHTQGPALYYAKLIGSLSAKEY